MGFEGVVLVGRGGLELMGLGVLEILAEGLAGIDEDTFLFVQCGLLLIARIVKEPVELRTITFRQLSQYAF